MREISIEEFGKLYQPFSIKPNPAMAIASDGERTNGLTIGWGSVGILWNKPIFTVYVHATRYSKEVFDNAEYFSVCFYENEYRKQLGYFGRVSGRDEDKMNNVGLTVNSNDVAPYFDEACLVVLCKNVGRSDFDVNHVDGYAFDWYSKDGVHTQYYGEIVKVLVKD